MTDESRQHASGGTATTSSTSASATRVGFCQECGRGLTAETLRRIGQGVFCDVCAPLQQAGGGWQSVPGNPYPGMGQAPNAPVGPGAEANPVLAGFLGLIPGVGAMFNGQYAKGAMHLIVFVVLVTLADNVNWVLWWLVWGWIFYQAFDAYHTARARRDRLPLPNPFGWNELGERMGFARANAPFAESPYTPSQSTEAPPLRADQPFPTEYAAHRPSRSPFAEAAYSQNPYTAPYTPPSPPPVPPSAPPAPRVPYVPTYTGAVPGQALGVQPRLEGTRRFPAGAFWLIGLGVLFLTGNLLPEWRLNGRWFAPLLLAVFAAWSAVRRWELHRAQQALGATSASLTGALMGPAVLFTVAALLALQAGHIAPLRRSWPVLLVIWGMMLLVQRSAVALAPSAAALPEFPEAAVPPVRSTSGTGSMGL